jgi:hypothetical protein
MRTAPTRCTCLTSVNCASPMLSSTPKRRAFGDFMVSLEHHFGIPALQAC